MNDKIDGLAKMVSDNIAPRTVSCKPDSGVDNAEVLLIPKGMEAHSMKKYIDERLPKPRRRIGIHNAASLTTLIDLTNRFKSEESVVFGDVKVFEEDGETRVKANFKTVFDFHPKGPHNNDADNREHIVRYDFPISSEMEKWLENNNKWMAQNEFALFLEDHINEIVMAAKEEQIFLGSLKPKFAEPLEILSLARDLEIYSTDQVKQMTKLSSGEREIRFSTEHSGADGKPLSIPDFFVISTTIFRGSSPIRIPVKLRYRKAGAGVVWSYQIYRIETVFETAFDSASERVRKETNLPVYIGEFA